MTPYEAVDRACQIASIFHEETKVTGRTLTLPDIRKLPSSQP